MGFLSNLFGGNKEDKALREALAHIHRILDDEKFQLELVHPMMKAILESAPAYDKDPNGSGPFGFTETNPIPVNGPIGQLAYLSRLETQSGQRILFHHLGAIDKVDVFEAVTFDGSGWFIFFVDLYHPRRSRLLATFAALMTLQAGPVLAENYEVSLTRKGSNVYKIDGKDIIIQTRYCYVYAYSEEAIFKASGYGGELIFFDSKDKCDVKAVFGLSKQKPGKYAVTVSRKDDDWYEVLGTDSYIKTSTCLSLALGEEAYLTISASGFGQLRFEDGDDCMVEGVYTKLRL